jgi:RNA recognition motif-containing protein
MDTVMAAASALLVDGLPLSVTSDNLKDLFVPFGPVAWARVVTDPMGVSLTFGYVAMATHEGAEAAMLALNGMQMLSRPLRIVHVTPPPLPRQL